MEESAFLDMAGAPAEACWFHLVPLLEARRSVNRNDVSCVSQFSTLYKEEVVPGLGDSTQNDYVTHAVLGRRDVWVQN